MKAKFAVDCQKWRLIDGKKVASGPVQRVLLYCETIEEARKDAIAQDQDFSDLGFGYWSKLVELDYRGGEGEQRQA